MRYSISTFITAAAAFAALPAQAAILGGAVTGGTAGGVFVQLNPAPGFTVGNNNQQSPNLFAFNEVQNLTLAAAIGAIPAGTKVNSHYVFFDPQPNRSVIGGVTFDGAILAVYSSTAQLLATDALFGRPGVTYLNPAARGLEAGDTFGVVGNVLSVRWTASTPGDYVRVITLAAVPEPQAWAMLLLGFFATGSALRRTRKARVALSFAR